jgi:hypothetical protein
MKCQDIQFELALYFDDILSSAEVERIDAHLAACPLCRETLAGHHDVRNELRSAKRPAAPESLVLNLREAVRAAVAPPISSPTFRLVEDRRSWLGVWLMPSAVGSFATVIFGITLGWLILNPIAGPSIVINDSVPSTMFIASANSNIVDGIDLSPLEYANTRLSVAGESPSVNPEGALVALSRSFVRGEMKDEEVVIVADVFGDGLARIAEIVEPSNDEQKILELRKAFQTRSDFAPFVPASMDRRGESVRVVLKFQSINVPVDYQGL